MVLAELSQPLRIAVYVYAAMSAITFVVFGFDKLAAWRGKRRVPEKTLHLLSFLGGWPGALLAQRRLRHKCSKGSYQFVFWLIVLAWQFAAADSLQNWKFSKAALNGVESMSNHRR